MKRACDRLRENHFVRIFAADKARATLILIVRRLPACSLLSRFIISTTVSPLPDINVFFPAPDIVERCISVTIIPTYFLKGVVRDRWPRIFLQVRRGLAPLRIRSHSRDDLTPLSLMGRRRAPGLSLDAVAGD